MTRKISKRELYKQYLAALKAEKRYGGLRGVVSSLGRQLEGFGRKKGRVNRVNKTKSKRVYKSSLKNIFQGRFKW